MIMVKHKTNKICIYTPKSHIKNPINHNINNVIEKK
jgi:hypothetical protein